MQNLISGWIDTWFRVFKDGTDGCWSKMKLFAGFCIQIALGCDSECLEKRIEDLERDREFTRNAQEEFDNRIETILVSKSLTN